MLAGESEHEKANKHRPEIRLIIYLGRIDIMHRLSSLMPSKMSLSQITTLHILFGLTVVLTTVSAGEWQTTGGQLCIDKCEKHDDVYPFYWCHVSDPSQVYSDGDKLSWWGHDDGNNPGTKLKWDYCVPSDLENDRAVDRYVLY